MLYTKADAQCDKQTTVVGRTKLTILATVDMQLRNFLNARRYASAIYAVVVCPSVRPSITCRYCIKTTKYKIKQTKPYDSPGALVFCDRNLGTLAVYFKACGFHWPKNCVRTYCPIFPHYCDFMMILFRCMFAQNCTELKCILMIGV